MEPSIQAAFVDFGVGRNGFLHISDVEPQYFRQGGYDPEEIMRESDEMAVAAAKRARESGRGSRHAFKGGRPRKELFVLQKIDDNWKIARYCFSTTNPRR